MTFKTSEDFHNKLGFIFHAMLALPLAVFVYLFLEIRHRALEPVLTHGGLVDILRYLLPVVAAMIVAGAYYWFKKQLLVVNSQHFLQERLSLYFKNSILFYVFIELASVILVGGLYLTTSAIFIVGYVLLLFLMSLNRPTPQKYVSDIRLSKAERDIILHKGNFSDVNSTNPEEN
ncbi:hypothetical protein C900_04819 [Fulvivirga imtechensis AK7]|uniref:Uncharacterized protein n=1 Tax=Fulvivirga imtechensis AK7 TaxID=1237149 RepID=L8JQ16_9BACT|nr:hypothetical protein [Fulvivirga imtechensis]ELR69594.1 hypothetical protein C900_04819 [Fulvivirga imtechensis AK7]